MTPDRIAELLSPFLKGVELSAWQLETIATYADLLMKWNLRVNLTAVRDRDRIITRHFGESMFAAKYLFPIPATPQTAIDVGSGAGFPGLPLKIWNPALDLTLIESNQRKSVFLREVIRALGFSNVRVLASRAEVTDKPAGLVTLRAVERFQQIVPVARRLVAKSGRIALLIGAAQIQTARELLGDVHWEEPMPLPLSENRSLLVGHTTCPGSQTFHVEQESV